MTNIKNTIKSGKPFLIYHNDEDEMALAVPVEFLDVSLYRLLRRFATSDIALMIPSQVASKIGMPYLSDALKLSANFDTLAKDAVVSSHAGPTFDLKAVKTGSADQEKVLTIRRLLEIVVEDKYELFFDEFAMPGHVRTYIAHKGLLNERIGHTELGVFLCLYAGLSGMICMVTVRDQIDGHPLNKAEGEVFAKENKYSLFYEEEILSLHKKQIYINDKVNSSVDTEEKLKTDYAKLVEIREFENILEKLFREKRIEGSYHLSIGQEATGVAIGNLLNKGDSLFVSHRGHHIALGIGVDSQKLFLECIGKEGGFNKGLAGPMHFSIQEPNLIIANGIVGANAPIATGIALSNKISKNNNICINVIGEGSLDEGPVHESLIMTSIWEVPLVIICENNFYSQSTPLKKHLPNENIAEHIEKTYKINSERVSIGTDLRLLEVRLKNAFQYVRETSRPIFIEVLTYRFCGHSMSDILQEYKDPVLNEYWLQQDPIMLFEKHLSEEIKVSNTELMEIKQEAITKMRNKIDEVF